MELLREAVMFLSSGSSLLSFVPKSDGDCVQWRHLQENVDRMQTVASAHRDTPQIVDEPGRLCRAGTWLASGRSGLAWSEPAVPATGTRR